MTDETLSDLWGQVALRRIYFGHQSVGQNIIDGVQNLCTSNRVPIRIVSGEKADLFTGPVFAHSPIGTNGDPRSKIDDFATKLTNDVGNRAEIAFFKLCYVDVTAATDVPSLFRYYAARMSHLKTEYPQTILAHVTVPITVAPRALPRWAGKLFRRPAASMRDNIARMRYNDLMRDKYAAREPLFDLSYCEATVRDDGPLVYRDSGERFWALDQRLTADGAHLDERGQRHVGASLLDFLSAIAQLRTPRGRIES